MANEKAKTELIICREVKLEDALSELNRIIILSQAIQKRGTEMFLSGHVASLDNFKDILDKTIQLWRMAGESFGRSCICLIVKTLNCGIESLEFHVKNLSFNGNPENQEIFKKIVETLIFLQMKDFAEQTSPGNSPIHLASKLVKLAQKLHNGDLLKKALSVKSESTEELAAELKKHKNW